jgi:hypothetical protein
MVALYAGLLGALARTSDRKINPPRPVRMRQIIDMNQRVRV